MMSEEIDKIRDLIASSKLPEAIKLLKSLVRMNQDLLNELGVVESNLFQLNREERIGTISFEEKTKSKNKISYSILRIANEFLNNETTYSAIDINEDVKIKNFISYLLEEIEILNIDLNWNSRSYIPLNAVIVDSNCEKSIKVNGVTNDLVESIMADKDIKATLIIGEPGTGKSIVLRKVCQLLLENWEGKDPIPIYINLNNLKLNQNEISDSYSKLSDYILKSIGSYSPPSLKKFIVKKYDFYYENGKLLFLFDSFDEIDIVLDNPENSHKIDFLSKLLFRFTGANRIVLASREYKKPTKKFLASKVYQVEGFTEKKFILYYQKILDKHQLKELVNNPSLSEISRNPFLASLIREYVEDNSLLPRNQFDIFKNTIDKRIVGYDYTDLKISSDLVFGYCINLASFTNRENSGTDGLSITQLKKMILDKHVFEFIQVLTNVGISRFGKGKFSFNHRRFSEYFSLLSMIDNIHELPLEDIPSNKKHRDSLVLLCQVAPIKTVDSIVSFCISRISRVVEYKNKVDSKEYKEAIHCLRFLTESLRSRSSILTPQAYEKILGFVNLQTQRGGNLIMKKHAIEATVLLNHSDAEKIIDNNFWITKNGELINSYLMKATINASNFLNKFNESLRHKFIVYFANSIGNGTFLTPRKIKEKIEYLSLFDSMKPIVRFLKAYYFEQIARIFIGAVFILGSLLLVIDSNIDKNGLLAGLLLIMSLSVGFSTFIDPELSISYPFYKDRARFILIIIGLFMLFMLVTTIMTLGSEAMFLNDWFFSTFLIVASIYIIFAFVVLIWGIISFNRYTRSSKNRLQDIKSNVKPVMYRQEIESYFFELEVPKYRLLFVKYLKEKGVTPIGDWSENELPNINDDEASGLLAELEEEWLCLKVKG